MSILNVTLLNLFLPTQTLTFYNILKVIAQTHLRIIDFHNILCFRSWLVIYLKKREILKY